jgi:hypothetical protein
MGCATVIDHGDQAYVRYFNKSLDFQGGAVFITVDRHTGRVVKVEIEP